MLHCKHLTNPIRLNWDSRPGCTYTPLEVYTPGYAYELTLS